MNLRDSETTATSLSPNAGTAPQMEAPISSAISELVSQIEILDAVIANLGMRLEPVRNVYPTLKDPGNDEPRPPRSQQLQIIQAAADRVRYARLVLENYTTELEI